MHSESPTLPEWARPAGEETVIDPVIDMVADPVADLVTDPMADPMADQLADPVIGALVDAVGAVGGADACWWSPWTGARWLYLIQAAADADLPGVTAAAQRVLAGAARVEVFARNVPLPRSHELALRAATLLWSARPAPPVMVAPVFDGAGPEGVWFVGDHELITDPTERAALLDFLTSGQIVLAANGRLADVVSGAASAVPANLRSDGRWVWSDATAYYLDRYGLAPDPGLVEQARSAPPGVGLTPLARHQVWAALQSLDEEESWPAR